MKGRTHEGRMKKKRKTKKKTTTNEKEKTQISQAKRKRENGIRPCPVLGVCVQREKRERE